MIANAGCTRASWLHKDSIKKTIWDRKVEDLEGFLEWNFLKKEKRRTSKIVSTNYTNAKKIIKQL